MNKLRKCTSCNIYSLKKNCPKCHMETVFAHPAKFSLDDRYAIYRVRSRYLENTQSE